MYAARKTLGDMPLIVLTAGEFFPMPEELVHPAEAWREAWRTGHDDIAALSTRGERRAIDAGHAIQWEKPEAVVAAIDEVLAQGRGGWVRVLTLLSRPSEAAASGHAANGDIRPVAEAGERPLSGVLEQLQRCRRLDEPLDRDRPGRRAPEARRHVVLDVEPVGPLRALQDHRLAVVVRRLIGTRARSSAA